MEEIQKRLSLCIRGKLVDLSSPLVMGIINYTPDSFYDGGRYNKPEEALARVEKMVEEGADIIDVGAASSRPGAEPVTPEIEIRRLSEVMEIIRKKFPELIISIDTYRSEVAGKMVSEFGAGMINDISAGDMDPGMFETVAGLRVPYVAMHMQGTPRKMQVNPEYDDVVNDILVRFAEKVHTMKGMGINDIILDPGFGFGKSIEHNYMIAARLEAFKIFGLPLMVGFSRKSMINKLLDISPEDSLAGTVALNTVALLKGADILRVHDVRVAKEVIEIAGMLGRFATGSAGVGQFTG